MFKKKVNIFYLLQKSPLNKFLSMRRMDSKFSKRKRDLESQQQKR